MKRELAAAIRHDIVGERFAAAVGPYINSFQGALAARYFASNRDRAGRPQLALADAPQQRQGKDKDEMSVAHVHLLS